MDWCLEDPRLDARAEISYRTLKSNPRASFPQIFQDRSALVGFYRFINNDRIDHKELMEAVSIDTFDRALDKKIVLAVHDTTQVNINAKADLIKEFKKKSDVQKCGFLAHVSLLLNPDLETNEVFGPCCLSTWSRGKGIKEAGRWFRHVEEVESSRQKNTIIHLMDREGDSYEIFGNLIASEYRFIIRLAHDRLIQDEECSKLFEFMSKKEVQTTRKVELSHRKASIFKKTSSIYPTREYREAKLSVSASAVRFKRGSWAPKDFPESLQVNIVRVFEEDPPQGEKPVQWFLVTTEPIDTTENILRVIDYYRKRWLIEEFFKALKSGCNLEERLLESAESWLKVFTLFLPIAVNLLNIRELGNHSIKNSPIFSEDERKVLKVQSKRLKLPLKTLADAKMVIARLGGYLPSKWPPGWIVLGRGYDTLRSWAEGVSMSTKL